MATIASLLRERVTLRVNSGYRRHPPRSQLVRAERGNPVEVRADAR